MHPAIEQFNEVAGTLLADVNAAQELYEQRPDGFTQRQYIRTLFTFLEGHLFAFKQTVLALEHILVPFDPLPSAKDTYIKLFHEEEKAMLEEFTYEMQSGGNAKKVSYHPRLPDSIRFTFHLFQRSLHLDDAIDYNTSGWQQLRDAQRIRNRITHPKRNEDLSTCDKDVAVVRAGITWYEDQVQHLLDRLEKESIFRHRLKLPNNDLS